MVFPLKNRCSTRFYRWFLTCDDGFGDGFRHEEAQVKESGAAEGEEAQVREERGAREAELAEAEVAKQAVEAEEERTWADGSRFRPVSVGLMGGMGAAVGHRSSWGLGCPRALARRTRRSAARI